MSRPAMMATRKLSKTIQSGSESIRESSRGLRASCFILAILAVRFCCVEVDLVSVRVLKPVAVVHTGLGDSDAAGNF